MTASESSLFTKVYNPLVQVGIVFGVSFVVMVLGKMVEASGMMYVGERFPWMTAAAFMLFYAVFNAILSLTAKDLNKYWGRSMLCFIGLAAANGLVAWLFSSISINEAGSYRWIYFVVTFGYLVFLSLVAGIKRIVEFAQREEWTQPRMRKRRKRK